MDFKNLSVFYESAWLRNRIKSDFLCSQFDSNQAHMNFYLSKFPPNEADEETIDYDGVSKKNDAQEIDFTALDDYELGKLFSLEIKPKNDIDWEPKICSIDQKNHPEYNNEIDRPEPVVARASTFRTDASLFLKEIEDSIVKDKKNEIKIHHKPKKPLYKSEVYEIIQNQFRNEHARRSISLKSADYIRPYAPVIKNNAQEKTKNEKNKLPIILKKSTKIRPLTEAVLDYECDTSHMEIRKDLTATEIGLDLIKYPSKDEFSIKNVNQAKIQNLIFLHDKNYKNFSMLMENYNQQKSAENQKSLDQKNSNSSMSLFKKFLSSLCCLMERIFFNDSNRNSKKEEKNDQNLEQIEMFMKQYEENLKNFHQNIQLAKKTGDYAEIKQNQHGGDDKDLENFKLLLEKHDKINSGFVSYNVIIN